ncbi:helix-turn-helix transcriptional regulator [Cytobacillus sp. FSL K6-0129]|uniref:helix-turn-helix domain-containing protein n=1 Tax=Cytobacillus sp. FSL K6-0129 TaxID=2921421 RepID=UPI0030F905F9
MRLELRLKELLRERGMEQKDLVELTGLTTRTISEMTNNKLKRYPKDALEKIMVALDLHEPNELFRTSKD